MRAAAALACGLWLLAGASQAVADADWDAVVQAAKQEGEVDVHGGPGLIYAEVLTQGFEQAYPGVKVSFSGTSGRDIILQILRERAAGIYRWDVYVGGTPSILDTLKPAGAFAPLKPALQPDLLKDSTWRGGFDAGWMDKEREYTYAFDMTVAPGATVNWDFVKRDELKTMADLLKPEFADKIAWNDPRLPGAGPEVAMAISANYGQDFLVRLLGEQKIVYTANLRQMAEWIVRGRTPIGLGVSNDIELFQEQGLGKNISNFTNGFTKLDAGPGFGTVSLMAKAPHPNAAKLYINWLLSKDGQTDYIRAERNSRRVDVPAWNPQFLPQPGVTYIDTQTEALMKDREAKQALAQKYLGAQKAQ